MSRNVLDEHALAVQHPVADSLADYFSDSYPFPLDLPTLETLTNRLVGSYLIPMAVIGVAEGRTSLGDGRDEPFRAMLLFVRSAILYREFCFAGAMADPGRCYEVMKVWVLHLYRLLMQELINRLQNWIFTFHGSSPQCLNYAAETLEVFCQFEFEFPPELRELVEERCWIIFPHDNLKPAFVDIYQEGNIRELKKGPVGGKVHEYDGRHLRDVISPNLDNFGYARRGMYGVFGLSSRDGKHGIKPDNSFFRKLYAAFEARGIATYRPGRSQLHIPRDDEQEGHAILQSDKGAHAFAARTTKDPLSVHPDERQMSKAEAKAYRAARLAETGTSSGAAGGFTLVDGILEEAEDFME